MPGDFGDGSQREDWGAVDQNAPSVANGQISPAQWAEYQQKRKRDAIIGILSTLGATTGLGALGGAIGGAGGAAGAASGGALPPVAGGAPWAITPYAGTAGSVGTGAAVGGGMVGAGAGAGMGAGGGAGAGALGMSARDLMSLGLGTAGMVGGAMSQPTNTDPSTATTDPNLLKLIQTMQGRMDQSEPLYKSIMSMANGLLPTQYQNGGSGR